MEEKVLFVVGSPRSGSTMLARMISSHSLVYGRPGAAPADAAGASRLLRQRRQGALRPRAARPSRRRSSSPTCRAASRTTSTPAARTPTRSTGACSRPSRTSATSSTRRPAYALVLDFIARIYPNAKYVVLTRHPLAVFSSFAESFFDSDYQAAHDYNPITERYVPAIAKFLRERKAPIHHVVYEKLVADPDTVMRGVFEFLGVPHEAEAIDYGKHEHEGKGLGDPIGVAKHSRPSTASLAQVGRRGRRRPGAPRAVQADRREAGSGRSRDLGPSDRDVLEAARRARRQVRRAEAEEARPLPPRAQGHRRAALAGPEERGAARVAAARRVSRPTCCFATSSGLQVTASSNSLSASAYLRACTRMRPFWKHSSPRRIFSMSTFEPVPPASSSAVYSWRSAGSDRVRLASLIEREDVGLQLGQRLRGTLAARCRGGSCAPP